MYDEQFLKSKISELLTQHSSNSVERDSVFGLLADLPLPIYITLDFHDLMGRALNERQRSPLIETCRWNRFMERQEPSESEPSVANPMIFHFYGTTQVPESLVLTEDNYLDFIFNVARNVRAIPLRIQRALTGTSLLFLGDKFDSFDLRVALRVIAYYRERSVTRRHIIQLPTPTIIPEQTELFRNYVDRYFSAQSMRVYWGTSREFCTELRERWTSEKLT
jgi:hypothetical protein